MTANAVTQLEYHDVDSDKLIQKPLIVIDEAAIFKVPLAILI